MAAAPMAGLWAMASARRIKIGKWGRKQAASVFKTTGLVTCLRISRNGTRLVTTEHRRACQVLNVTDRRAVWSRPELGLGVQPHLSPSGRYLFLLSIMGELEIVDLGTQNIIRHALPSPTGLYKI